MEPNDPILFICFSALRKHRISLREEKRQKTFEFNFRYNNISLYKNIMGSAIKAITNAFSTERQKFVVDKKKTPQQFMMK